MIPHEEIRHEAIQEMLALAAAGELSAEEKRIVQQHALG